MDRRGCGPLPIRKTRPTQKLRMTSCSDNPPRAWLEISFADNPLAYMKLCTRCGHATIIAMMLATAIHAIIIDPAIRDPMAGLLYQQQKLIAMIQDLEIAKAQVQLNPMDLHWLHDQITPQLLKTLEHQIK